MRVTGIVSGGQSGVDRAALDAALAAGIPYAGWCPRDGRAEDAPDPPGVLADYPLLRATPEGDPVVRTRLNVRDSEAVLVLGSGASPGTALAVAEAERLGRPTLTIDGHPAAGDGATVSAWLAALDPAEGRLNVAGPRESESPGIYAAALAFLTEVLRETLA